jgi:hypothetical protein
MLRSRAYVQLLVVAAVLGVGVSAAAWGFLALVSKLQHWLYVSLPSDLGINPPPLQYADCRTSRGPTWPSSAGHWSSGWPQLC